MNTIADVIGWKFNHQQGMRCREIDGILEITEFPGGIPSQANQGAWTAEYDVAVAADARRNELTARLSEIDTLSIRALRAKSTGRGNPQDDTSLSSFEDEAEAIRAELGGL